MRRLRLRSEQHDTAPAAPGTACRAPLTSMYLDQFGDVRACCMNIHHPLGNITKARLADIWRGEQAEVLRRALADEDFSKGCEWCEWPVGDGRPDLAFARWFDRFEPDGPERPLTAGQQGPGLGWPRQIEFSVSNTCNLQCVMCNGDWSSSIRSQREGRPPLPSVYGDEFFEDLDAFLPHLQQVKFLGGEPFLAAETLRIMERLITLGLSPLCHITTNGTQWTPRVERVLEMLPVDIAMSLDAATADTYHAIRQGSSWDVVMANLDRFCERARASGTKVDLTYCLMRPNWREFGQFCLMAEERGLYVTVNTVTHPAHLSLHHAELDELEEVVADLEAEQVDLLSRLDHTRVTFEDEVARLRARRDELRQQAEDRDNARIPLDVRLGSEAVRYRRPPEAPEAIARWRTRHVTGDAARIRLSVTSRVTEFVPGGPLLALGPDTFTGHGSGDLQAVLETVVPGLGQPRLVDELHDCLAFRVEVDGQPEWAVLVEPVVDGEGYERGTVLSFSLAEALPA